MCSTICSTNISKMEKKACAKNIDRLSNLPDVLLLNIMSYLRTRQAVQTCVLSKRWRSLWAYIPSVFLDYEEFRNWDGVDHEKFACFVNSFFILSKISKLDSFQLHWFNPNIKPLIARTWIHRVVECKPRIVHMNLCDYGSVDLPQSLFTCTSIEVMILMICGGMLLETPTIQHKSIFLPCLRSLTISCVALSNDFMKKLTQGCHSLEKMIMNRCKLDVADISSPCLRSLIIEFCEMKTEVCFSMPNLVALEIKKVESGMILLRNMSSLLKASLSLCSIKSALEYKKSKYEFLSGLSNATYIELYESRGYTQIRGLLAEEFLKCPTFKNLKSLYLNECFLCQDFNLIAWFVHLAPNLERLKVCPRENLMWRWEDEDELFNNEYIFKLGMPLQYKCTQLEVEIQYHENVSGVQNLVKKFMENIKTLKKISITSW